LKVDIVSRYNAYAMAGEPFWLHVAKLSINSEEILWRAFEDFEEQGLGTFYNYY
jgi:hypothetical protein